MNDRAFKYHCNSEKNSTLFEYKLMCACDSNFVGKNV